MLHTHRQNKSDYLYLLQANLSFWWGGWSDDLSGLDHYEYILFYLGVNGRSDHAELIDGAGAGGKLMLKHNVPVNLSSVSYNGILWIYLFYRVPIFLDVGKIMSS